MTGGERRVDDADAPQERAVAYHAPVPDSYTLIALDVERVLHVACRLRGDRPLVLTRWPVPREA